MKQSFWQKNIYTLTSYQRLSTLTYEKMCIYLSYCEVCCTCDSVERIVSI